MLENNYYKIEKYAEDLMEEGWIPFQEAYADLLQDENFVQIIQNCLGKFIYEQYTEYIKNVIVSNLIAVIMSYTDSKMDYELKVASPQYNNTELIILARKL